MGMQSYDRGVMYGMSLAMRIMRNRVQDLKAISESHKSEWPMVRENEIYNCIGIVRCVQVEIGSGRMEKPMLSINEQDEINRIR